jgi:hypothetical protein
MAQSALHNFEIEDLARGRADPSLAQEAPKGRSGAQRRPSSRARRHLSNPEREVHTVPNPPSRGKETRRQKFERLASRRVSKTLKQLRLIGNLASPNYSWTPAMIEQMRNAIAAGLEESLERFEKRRRVQEKFTFVAPEPPMEGMMVRDQMTAEGVQRRLAATGGSAREEEDDEDVG